MPYVLETEVRYDNSYFAILFESEVEAYKCAAASIKCDVGHMTDSDYVFQRINMKKLLIGGMG
jgi:hypothetical protein